VIAYHEAGHALIAWLTPEADPVHKVSIMPRGRALGVTEQLPDGDRYHHSQEYLLARLAVMLGGRAAEEAALGEVSTGAEDDLIEATRLARRMVTRWGMGSLGVMAFIDEDEQPLLGAEPAQGRSYSEETAARIDQDMQRFLTECYEKDLQQLTGNRLKLDAVVHALLQDETIGQEVLTRILGARGQAVNTAGEQPVLSYGRPGLRRGSP
jgi:cell division protease FtsH